MLEWLRATFRPIYGKLAWIVALCGPTYRAVYGLVDFLGNVEFTWDKLGKIPVDLSWLRVPEWPHMPAPPDWALLAVTALGFLAVCIVGVIETRRARGLAQQGASAKQPAPPASRPIKRGIKITDTLGAADSASIATARPTRLAGTRSAKVEAMNLAGEIEAWANSWDARPAWVGGDFEMISEFQIQFGARLEALIPFVPMLTIAAGGVVGGVALVSDTDSARRIASELNSFANSFG